MQIFIFRLKFGFRQGLQLTQILLKFQRVRNQFLHILDPIHRVILASFLLINDLLKQAGILFNLIKESGKSQIVAGQKIAHSLNLGGKAKQPWCHALQHIIAVSLLADFQRTDLFPFSQILNMRDGHIAQSPPRYIDHPAEGNFIARA